MFFMNYAIKKIHLLNAFELSLDMLLKLLFILGHFGIEGCDLWYACTEPYFRTDDDEMLNGTNRQRRHQLLKSPLYESI